MRWYILKNRVPVPTDCLTHAKWRDQTEEWIVGKTDLPAGGYVSTVFLGLDHNYGFSDDERPVLFETMVFNSQDEGGEQCRYHTYEEALSGHNAMARQHGGQPFKVRDDDATFFRNGL